MGEHGILLVCGVLSSLLRGAQFTLTDTMHIGLRRRHRRGLRRIPRRGARDQARQ